MEQDILFSEKQKFNQWWVWLIIFLSSALVLFAIVQQIISGTSSDNKTLSNIPLLIFAGSTFLPAILFANIKLETFIKKNGIYVRFFPFQTKFKYYPWDTIAQSYIREYAAFKEYGGWGLRQGLSGKGTAYTVSGNKGLQLELTNNKKVLIGTTKAEALEQILTIRNDVEIKPDKPSN